MGGRSSGKSYTLNKLYNTYENVKYIRQFQLLEIDPSKAEQDFSEKIAAKQSVITRDYFLQFSKIVDEVKDISLSNIIHYTLIQFLEKPFVFNDLFDPNRFIDIQHSFRLTNHMYLYKSIYPYITPSIR